MVLKQPVSRDRRPHPAPGSLPAWLGIALMGATLLLITSYAIVGISESDLWWQMKTGELILKSGHVPTTDPFSFTAPGHPWIAQEWLVEVLFYGLYTHLGPLSLVAFKLVAAALAFGLLMARCLRRSSGDVLLSILLVLLAAGATRWYLNLRPQQVSFVLLGVLMWVLEGRKAEAGERKAESDGSCSSPVPPSALPLPPSVLRWAPAAILALWVNCHAAFVLGLGIVGAYAVGAWWEGERGKRWLVAWGLPGLAALGATLLNPYSYHALLYPFALTGNNLMMWLNEEWISPDFQGIFARPHLAMLLIALAAFALSSRPRRFVDIALICGALHLSLVSNRHVPMFALAVTPIVAEHASSVLRDRWPRLRTQTYSWGVAALVALYLAVTVPARLTQLPRQNWFQYCAGMGTFPVAACDYLDRQGWSGRVFHDLVWGGYLIWRYDGKRPIFVDGRNEVFFEGAFQDCYRVTWCERDTQAILDKWKIDTMLIMRNQMLETWLRRSPLWSATYEDDVAVVFHRRDHLASGRGGNA